jgi:NADH:ubiquinone reductase (H+-translocating)
MKNDKAKRSLGASLVYLGLSALGGYLAWNFVRRVRTETQNQSLARGKKIMILGAGFGGRQVALELARQLPNDEDGEILLVDQEPYLLFTPMLAEAAGGELDADHIVSPATHLPKRITFVQGQIESIDLQSRSITLRVGHRDENIPERNRTLSADHLVLALGSVTNFHQIPGVQEHSIGIKSLAEAAVLRDRILELLQRASVEPDETVRRELLTIVVGGGGLTGVEIMASINSLLRDSAQKFPRINPAEIRTMIIDPGTRILPELHPSLARYAHRELERRGVEIRLSTFVTQAGEDFVALDDERVAARSFIWAGGVRPNPILHSLDCAHGRHGAVVVDEFLTVPGFHGVWALGDSAQVPHSVDKGFYAPTAQNAVHEGTLVGRNIAAVLRGQPPRQFRFKPMGELALVGRHAGVARILGFQFTGIAAWASWRLIYLAKMPGLAQRMRVLTDWVLDCMFGRNLAPLPPVPTHHVRSLAE